LLSELGCHDDTSIVRGTSTIRHSSRNASREIYFESLDRRPAGVDECFSFRVRLSRDQDIASDKFNALTVIDGNRREMKRLAGIDHDAGPSIVSHP
jgi:hypothetical protein